MVFLLMIVFERFDFHITLTSRTWELTLIVTKRSEVSDILEGVLETFIYRSYFWKYVKTDLVWITEKYWLRPIVIW